MKMALVNPVVGFSFKADGRELLSIKPENEADALYLNRIRNLMGTSFADEAIKIKNSKAIKKLSTILVEEYDSKIPCDIDKLEKLPGVGHKTASVVISQGFGIPAFPVDTHIHRLAQRWGLTSGKNVVITERDLKKIFPEENWNKLHLQIIFWGREFCTARSCFALECEICRACNPKRVRRFLHKQP